MKIQDIVTKPEQVSDQASQDVSKVVNTDVNVDTNVQTKEKVEQVDDNTQQTNSDDILTKVTRFVDTKSPAKQSEDDIDADIYNDGKFREKIDSIEDPELKAYMTALRKTGVSGIGSRLEEISTMRKELTELKNGMNPGWTPQRVQELLKNQDFLTSAESILGNTNEQQIIGDDEYVPDSVKQTLTALQEENAQFKQQFNTLSQNQTQENFQREHKQLSEKYGNYNSEKIDNVRAGLISGKIKATSEDLYKIVNYEENINNAYKMGLQDRNGGAEEKQQISSFPNNTVQQPNTEIQAEKGETNKQFLNRIIQNNLDKLKR